LIKHPNDEHIESTLSANWHTEGFVGSASVHFTKKLSTVEKWAKDPETSVAKWANKEVEYIKRRIKNAEREEEEREF